MTNFQTELSLQIKARFPVIYLIAWEEQRLVATIKEMANDNSLFSKARDVWEWTVIDGFKCNGKTVTATLKPRSGRWNLSTPTKATVFLS
jgi:hypothetical protein